MLFPLYSFGNYVCPSDLPGVGDIFTFINSMEAVTDCSPLNVGGIKVVDSQAESGSENTMQTHQFGDEHFLVPAASRYLIRRPAEDQYEMVFNVNFNPRPNAGMTPEQMRVRLNNCMQEASTQMRGPNGEQLSISIVSPEMIRDASPSRENSTRRQRRAYSNLTPPQIDIDLLPPSTHNRPDGTSFIDRVRADFFAADSPCSTLVHEMLHWGGLCDEYTETVPEGTDPASIQPAGCRLPSEFDIRALGRSDSYMADYIQTIYNARVGNISNCRFNSNSSDSTVARDGRNLRDFVNANKENESRMQVLMRRSFSDINVETLRLGITGANRNAKDLFCSVLSTENTSSEVSSAGALTTINERNSSKVSFNYYDYLYTVNASTTQPQRMAVNCDCAGRGNLTAACMRFLEILNFELDSFADPNARVYQCPFGSSRETSEDYSRQPGALSFDDGRISFRSKPIDSNKSLLYPAHFLRLVNGECEALQNGTPAQREILRNYNACARFSVSTSMETLGRNRQIREGGNKVMRTCDERPAYCYDVDQWLGTR